MKKLFTVYIIIVTLFKSTNIRYYLIHNVSTDLSTFIELYVENVYILLCVN